MEIFARLLKLFWRYLPLKPKSITPVINHSVNRTSQLFSLLGNLYLMLIKLVLHNIEVFFPSKKERQFFCSQCTLMLREFEIS